MFSETLNIKNLMNIGIGSTNMAKLIAVETAFHSLKRAFSNHKEMDFAFLPMETATVVAAMPLTCHEIMSGARQRALFVFKACQKKSIRLDFAIGLEGGVYKASDNKQPPVQTYLQNWVYAFDGERGSFGSSVSLPLPEAIAGALYKEGRELADVIDSLSGLNDVRSNEGAFGILTHNLITRSQSFEMAIIAAMTPFMNQDYYNTAVH